MNTVPHNAGPLSGCILVNAEDVRVSDEVCFKLPAANYIVREVSESNGVVRHYFGEEASSNAYRHGERLYVRRATMADLPHTRLEPVTMKGLVRQQLVQKHGIDFSEDFHALSSDQVLGLLHWADAWGYKAPKNASGSRAICFFNFIARK